MEKRGRKRERGSVDFLHFTKAQGVLVSWVEINITSSLVHLDITLCTHNFD